MHSYQNLETLSNLYRLKALGFNYTDAHSTNVVSDNHTLPNSVAALHNVVNSCYLCDLAKSSKYHQFGFGDTSADIMFIDAYPLLDNKNITDYYNSKTGSMLKNMIENVLEIPSDSVYITFLVKCKPSGFSIPNDDEYHSCLGYLLKQIELIGPKLIVSLGEIPYKFLTNDTTSTFNAIKGEIISFLNTKLITIHHPSFLLHNPSQKKETMRDLLIIKGAIK